MSKRRHRPKTPKSVDRHNKKMRHPRFPVREAAAYLRVPKSTLFNQARRKGMTWPICMEDLLELQRHNHKRRGHSAYKTGIWIAYPGVLVIDGCVTVDIEVMDGAACLVGTRLPVGLFNAKRKQGQSVYKMSKEYRIPAFIISRGMHALPDVIWPGR